MESLKAQKEALTAQLAEIDKVAEVQEQILTLLKGAGYDSLEAFQAKLASFKSSKAPATTRGTRSVKHKSTKRATSGSKRGRRPRITADQVAKMKSLRETNTPRSKIAKELGVSVGAIIQWEKKKFVYPTSD